MSRVCWGEIVWVDLEKRGTLVFNAAYKFRYDTISLLGRHRQRCAAFPLACGQHCVGCAIAIDFKYAWQTFICFVVCGPSA